MKAGRKDVLEERARLATITEKQWRELAALRAQVTTRWRPSLIPEAIHAETHSQESRP